MNVHQLILSAFLCFLSITVEVFASYSEVEEAAASAVLTLIDRKVHKENLQVDAPCIKEAFAKIFSLMKEGKVDPNKKIKGVPIFFIFLHYDHYDHLAKEYHQLFAEKIPVGNFDGNIFHYLASIKPEVTDQEFRLEMLETYVQDPDCKTCLKDEEGLTPAMYALKVDDYNYLRNLYDKGILCRNSKDKKGNTIIAHLKKKKPELLRELFPDIWLSSMEKKHQKFTSNINHKLKSRSTNAPGKKRKISDLGFKLPEAHETITHCTKKPKVGDICNICRHELNKDKRQILSNLCGKQCDKMVCLECAESWKQQCLNGQHLECSCVEEDDKKFLPNSAIAAFGANNCEIFDIYVRKLRILLGSIEGFTPCLTPDCHGGTILKAKEKTWHECELCEKECHLLGKDVVRDDQEIPKPWEKPRPCPYCYHAYYEITDACDHIRCENCDEDFNVVFGKSSDATYFYNDDDPYNRIRRYRIPGDLKNDSDPYLEYQDDVMPEDDIDLEAIGITKKVDD